MTDALTNVQLLAFFWDAFKGLGTVLILIIGYFLRGWISTQKQHGDKIVQMVSDMRSLSQATQNNTKAITDMIAANEKSMKAMVASQEKVNEKLIETFNLMMENKILRSQNTS